MSIYRWLCVHNGWRHWGHTWGDWQLVRDNSGNNPRNVRRCDVCGWTQEKRA